MDVGLARIVLRDWKGIKHKYSVTLANALDCLTTSAWVLLSNNYLVVPLNIHQKNSPYGIEYHQKIWPGGIIFYSGSWLLRGWLWSFYVVRTSQWLFIEEKGMLLLHPLNLASSLLLHPLNKPSSLFILFNFGQATIDLTVNLDATWVPLFGGLFQPIWSS